MKNGKQGYFTTYFFDYAMLCLKKSNREMNKCPHLTFNPRKAASESLRTTEAYAALAAKVYNALLLNHIQPEFGKNFRKSQNGFRRNRFLTF